MQTFFKKLAAELTTEGRDQIKKKNFAIPKGRRYPIHDEEHARNALARVGQHGTPGEKSQVYAAVTKKYPGLSARSSVPGVQKKVEEKKSCGSCKMAAMRQELEQLKLAGAFDRLRELANPMTHLGTEAYEVGGLGVLAAPEVDKLQAMARARLAGESGDEAVQRRRFISSPVASGMELGGLGILAAPSAGKLVQGLRH